MKESTKELIDEVGTNVTSVAAGSAVIAAASVILTPFLKVAKPLTKCFYFLGIWTVGIATEAAVREPIKEVIHNALELMPTTPETNEKDDVPDNVVVLDNEEAPQ